VADLRLEVPTLRGPLTVAGLTVSIGGAVASPDGSDLAALLQTADTALYEAKRAGRNTVRVAVASSVPSVVNIPSAPLVDRSSTARAKD
jgi:predicted signal transduction protein with EAL and GGDEF domain